MPVSNDESKLRVFISYSRSDLAFADQLVIALEQEGFQVLIDRRDLPYGEEWQKELGDFIRGSDTVIWLVSPDSIRSDWCNWELGLVGDLKKRLIPIKIRDTEISLIPKAIGKIHLLPAEGLFTLIDHLQKLVDTLNRDTGWLKQHTRLAALAERWVVVGKSDDALIRGIELENAELWATSRPRYAPSLTDAQSRFIQLSRENQRERNIAEQRQIERTKKLQRRVAWSLLGISLVLAVGAFLSMLQTRAVAKREALVFTTLAQQAMDEGDNERAIRYALHGLPTGKGNILAPWSEELEAKLKGAIIQNRLRAKLQGHTAWLTDVAISPDGKLVATASFDQTIRVWRTETAQEVSIFKRHEETVGAIVFSPDGKYVASSSPSTVRVWSAITGEQTIELEKDGSRFVSITFSPDGKHLAIANGLRAQVFEALTGKLSATMEGHTGIVSLQGENIQGHIRAIDISPDGRFLLTGAGDNTARVWDFFTGQQIAVLDGHTEPITTARFSADGHHVLSASSDHTAKIWDLKSARTIATLTGHSAPITDADFSRDGSMVVTGSEDSTARIWDAQKGTQLFVLRGHSDWLHTTRFNPDGSLIVSSSKDGTARVWNPRSGLLISSLVGHREELSTAKFSHDGSFIVTASLDKAARIWQARRSNPRSKFFTKFLGHEHGLLTVRFSPNGERLLISSLDRASSIWNPWTGKKVAMSEGVGGQPLGAYFGPASEPRMYFAWDTCVNSWSTQSTALVKEYCHDGARANSVAVGRDGKRVAVMYNDGSAKVFDGSTTEIVSVARSRHLGSWAIQLSNDLSQIVTASTDGLARSWDASTGAPLITFRGHESKVTYATYSSDDKFLLTSSYDGTARIWDATSGESVAILRGHKDIVFRATFSKDGGLVATASNDRSVGLWDARTGTLMAMSKGHSAPIRDVAFHPAEKAIIFALEDGNARLWDVSSGVARNSDDIRQFSCERALKGAHTFTSSELDIPVFRDLDKKDPFAINPCVQNGFFSLKGWWHTAIELYRSTVELIE